MVKHGVVVKHGVGVHFLTGCQKMHTDPFSPFLSEYAHRPLFPFSPFLSEYAHRPLFPFGGTIGEGNALIIGEAICLDGVGARARAVAHGGGEAVVRVVGEGHIRCRVVVIDRGQFPEAAPAVEGGQAWSGGGDIAAIHAASPRARG